MTAALVAAPARRGRFAPGVWAAAVFLVLLAVAALAPGLLAHGSPNDADTMAALQGPGAGHLLGTDANGRDIATRIVHGVRPSLLTGLGAVGLAVTAGTLLGLSAGLGGRVVDEIVMRAVDVLLSLPNLLLALVVLTILGPGTVNAVYAIALYLVPGYARLVRVQVRVIRTSGHVEAATSLGLTRLRIIRRHILPNAFAPLLVLVTVEIGIAMVAGASLSFLGFGARPPDPEWGAMLAAGRDYFSVAWWVAVFPGLAITLTVLAFTVVGRRFQLRLEGRTA
ncbi:ABC transporter permease [Actinomadura flavalba]|uniref:ABC transporter permease n=1 Tax=Actinomadura flavalba TaxID=1120938 RepID=UPI000372E0C8|nr:ABC transporter permease [Actinomadura flavalba]